MAKTLLPGYLLYCDDSGSGQEPIRALAAVSGPAKSLFRLDEQLRVVLQASAMDELKWTALRTRTPRLNAAEAYIDLACALCALGQLRIDVMVYDLRKGSAALRGMDDRLRLRALYADLWSTAITGWPQGRWRLFPDERTGMAWRGLVPSLNRGLAKRKSSLSGLRERRSHTHALIQFADLFAGLARFAVSRESSDPSRGARGDGARARSNRESLLAHWVGRCRDYGLPLTWQPGHGLRTPRGARSVVLRTITRAPKKS